MGESTAIEWCDHTFNPWWGCTKVSEACRNCYAEGMWKRFGVEPGRRRFFGEKHWREPLKWNRKAERDGVRRKAFCASMADAFEDLPEGHPDGVRLAAARGELGLLIEKTPALDWLLLTKRPENAQRLSPRPRWRDEGWPPNVWLGTTVENQATADERIPHLLRAPAAVRFLSCEPLLGPVTLDDLNANGTVLAPECWGDCKCDSLYGYDAGCSRNGGNGSLVRRIDWVIVGGESGPKARPMDPDWARSLRDQCADAGVPFMFKQWGAWGPAMPGHSLTTVPGHTTDGGVLYRVGKKVAGCLLDDREHKAFPEMPR